jgi:3-methyladenine DNA glycosylase AlkD
MRSIAKPQNLDAKRCGRDQKLAEELWATRIPEARILASLVADPALIGSSTMDRWAHDFSCWTVCDACCWNLFGHTPYAWRKLRKWARDEREFVRRAAFATIAGLAVHDKTAEDAVFDDALRIIEEYSFDDRNFVKKAVNWALRNIGKRNARWRVAAGDNYTIHDGRSAAALSQTAAVCWIAGRMF